MVHRILRTDVRARARRQSAHPAPFRYRGPSRNRAAGSGRRNRSAPERGSAPALTSHPRSIAVIGDMRHRRAIGGGSSQVMPIGHSLANEFPVGGPVIVLPGGARAMPLSAMCSIRIPARRDRGPPRQRRTSSTRMARTSRLPVSAAKERRCRDRFRVAMDDGRQRRPESFAAGARRTRSSRPLLPQPRARSWCWKRAARC